MTDYFNTFKTAANNRAITAQDIVILCLYKALRCKSEDKVGVAKALLLRAFTPITKASKLNAGAKPYQTLNNVLGLVRYYLSKERYSYLTAEEMKSLHDIAIGLERF